MSYYSDIMDAVCSIDMSDWRFVDGRTYHWDGNQWREVEFYGTASNQWRYKP